jgi:fructosamine-3-kinase
MSANPKMTLDINTLHLSHFQTGSHVTSDLVSPDRYCLTQTFPNNPSEPKQRYFLKCVRGEGAGEEVKYEYETMRRFAEHIPGSTPKPVEWSKGKDCYCLLSHFEDDSAFHDSSRFAPERLFDLLALLHTSSRDKHALFGRFPLNGETPMAATKNWTECLQNLLETAMKDDSLKNGAYEGSPRDTATKFLHAVVPKLISSIEGEVIPCLIHGYLTSEKVKEKLKGGVFLFGSEALYAHDEMEFGIFRCRFSKLNPEDNRGTNRSSGWEDRNIMYSVLYNLRYSARFGQEKQAVEAREE